MPKKPHVASIRNAITAKLNIKTGQIYVLAKKLATQAQTKAEDGIYLLAAKNGINLTKFLPPEKVAQIRELIFKVNQSSQTLQSHSTSQVKQKRKISTLREEKRIVILAKEIEIADPILTIKEVSEAKDMSAIYPLLYIMENSIREFLNRVMIAAHGSTWWDTQAPKGLRETVAKRMSDEQKNSWHQRRSDHLINYLDLDQLPALVRRVEKKVVPKFFPSVEWFTQFIEEVYQSRCVLCHMNPLDKDNIQAVRLRFKQWQKLLSEKKRLLPRK